MWAYNDCLTVQLDLSIKCRIQTSMISSHQ